MSLTDQVRAQLAHAIENGHAVDFPAPLQETLLTLAAATEAAGGVSIEEVDAKLDALLQTKLGAVDAAIDHLAKNLERQLTERLDYFSPQFDKAIEAKVNALLAAAPAPAEPALDVGVVFEKAPAAD